MFHTEPISEIILYFDKSGCLYNLTYQYKDTLAYKTIINLQIKPTISVIAIAIHFVTPIQKDRTRYDWFSIWKCYLYLDFYCWSLCKYVQKQQIESTDIAWNEFVMWYSVRTIDRMA